MQHDNLTCLVFCSTHSTFHVAKLSGGLAPRPDSILLLYQTQVYFAVNFELIYNHTHNTLTKKHTCMLLSNYNVLLILP